MGSNVPVMNESTNEMIYEMNHILNCRYEIKGSFEPTNDQHAYVCMRCMRMYACQDGRLTI